MRHGVDGRKFSRNTSHRKAMFRNMANSVIKDEQIVTTVQKAKEARRVVDRLITIGKKQAPASRRLLFDRTRSKLVVEKLVTVLADRYKSRNGGYTRVLKMSERRWGDNAEMALLELVDHPPLDRKRKVRSSAETEKAGAEAATEADPFKGFRKVFSGKKSKSKSSKTSPKAKKAAAPKAPAQAASGSKKTAKKKTKKK